MPKTPTFLSGDYIDRLFTYRKWTEAEIAAYRPIREAAKALAHQINEVVPDSPQKTRAINALHEMVYLVNTAATLNPLSKEE